MVYAWNGFVLLAHNKACLGNMLTYTWLELAKVEDGKGSCLGEEGGRREGHPFSLCLLFYTEHNPYYCDDWCVVKLLQGVCFGGLGRLDEAEGCFASVIERFVC